MPGLVEFECPKCKGHLCEIWGLDGSNLGIRLMYWHAILNPGIAFNELVLGQRSPQRVYVCKSCDLPMVDRGYVHCSECGTFHNGRIWSHKNAFGNWIGLACPSCSALIPCMWNLTSRLLLLVSAPVWWFPVKQYKTKLIAQQYKRIADNQTNYVDEKSNTPIKINYTRMGLQFGFLMGLCMAFLPFVLLGISGFSHQFGLGVFFISILGFLISIPSGLLFGFMMKSIMDKKGDQRLHLTFDADGKVVPLNEPAESRPQERDVHEGIENG